MVNARSTGCSDACEEAQASKVVHAHARKHVEIGYSRSKLIVTHAETSRCGGMISIILN